MRPDNDRKILFEKCQMAMYNSRMHAPYYEKPRFKLYQANCLDILAEPPENSVDMIFADPPYLLSSSGV